MQPRPSVTTGCSRLLLFLPKAWSNLATFLLSNICTFRWRAAYAYVYVLLCHSCCLHITVCSCCLLRLNTQMYVHIASVCSCLSPCLCLYSPGCCPLLLFSFSWTKFASVLKYAHENLVDLKRLQCVDLEESRHSAFQWIYDSWRSCLRSNSE